MVLLELLWLFFRQIFGSLSHLSDLGINDGTMWHETIDTSRVEDHNLFALFIVIGIGTAHLQFLFIIELGFLVPAGAIFRVEAKFEAIIR